MENKYSADVFVIANTREKLDAMINILEKSSLLEKSSSKVQVKPGNQPDTYWYYATSRTGDIKWMPSEYSWGWKDVFKKCGLLAGRDGAVIANVTDSPFAEFKGNEISESEHVATTPKGGMLDYNTYIGDEFDGYEKFRKSFVRVYGEQGRAMFDIYENSDNSTSEEVYVPKEDFVIENGVLKRYEGNSRNVVIPENVTRIGEFSFENCKDVVNVTIPDSVTTIGKGAFLGCSSLTGITIPDSVTCIEGGVFNGCERLADNNDMVIINSILFIYSGRRAREIKIPEGVTSIGNNAFQNNQDLTGIELPDSLTSIGVDAFFGCRNLKSITIPDGVTGIGEHAFAGCISLTSITIPNSVTSIGKLAFAGCSSLMNISIPDSVTSIGADAFKGCDKLEWKTQEEEPSLASNLPDLKQEEHQHKEEARSQCDENQVKGQNDQYNVNQQQREEERRNRQEATQKEQYPESVILALEKAEERLRLRKEAQQQRAEGNRRK